MKNYEKYIKNGLVAVLYTSSYGAGWYSWNNKHEGLLFDKDIVQAVLDRDNCLAAKIAKEKYDDVYTNGSAHLSIWWLMEGTVFCIKEYDGFEKVQVIQDLDLKTA